MATVLINTPQQQNILQNNNNINVNSPSINFSSFNSCSQQHQFNTNQMMTPNYSYLTPSSASTMSGSSSRGSFPGSPHSFHPATSSWNTSSTGSWNSNSMGMSDSDMGTNSWETDNGWKRYPTAPTTGGANMKWEKKADGSTTTNYTVSKYSKFVNNLNCDTAQPQNIDRDDVKPDGSVFYIRVVEINYWAKEARDAILQEDTLALIRGMCGSVNVQVKGMQTTGQPPRGCFPLFIECSGLDWIQCEQAVKHIEEVADYIMTQN